MISCNLFKSGMLAEKAIQSQVPRDFPFTVRVSCDVTDSNGNHVIPCDLSCDSL